MAKDPAFLFYSSDFLMGTLVLSMEQRGQYITILALMHQHGRLTLEEMEIALHCKVSEKVLKKLKKDSENKYYNERLEFESTKRSEFSKSRRNSLKIDNGDMVHLYLIKAKDEELYKIGSSKYPQLRLKEVQKYKPGSEFFWISDGLYERINEKHLHDQFKDKRFKYDWFNLSQIDLKTITNLFSETSRTTLRTEDRNVIINTDNNIIGTKGVQGETDFSDYENWTKGILSGDDWLFNDKARNMNIPIGERLEEFANSHLALLAKYPKMKPTDQNRFRISLIGHIQEKIQERQVSKPAVKKVKFEDV